MDINEPTDLAAPVDEPTMIMAIAQAVHYTSTACVHGVHDECRFECKFCNKRCRCECHDATHPHL